MVIAVESLLFLLAGIILAVVLIRIFGRGGEGRGATIRLVRSLKPADGTEETRLLINDQPILTASSAGLRLADYSDEVERLETLATRIASALGATVELARSEGKDPGQIEGVPVRKLPHVSTGEEGDAEHPAPVTGSRSQVTGSKS